MARSARIGRVEILNIEDYAPPAFDPQVLACHHGSVITGQVGTYIKALRDNDVTGIVVPNP